MQEKERSKEKMSGFNNIVKKFNIFGWKEQLYHNDISLKKRIDFKISDC